MLKKLAARDVAIAALLIGIWTVEQRLTPRDGTLFWLLSVLGGLAYAVMGFLLHEWGHLAGSKLSGSVVHPSPSLTNPLLFHFDSGVNDRRQFLWMSFGGYLASAAWLTFVLAIVDTSRWSGRLGIGVVALGIVGTFVAEVPSTVRVWRGAPQPTGAVFSKWSG